MIWMIVHFVIMLYIYLCLPNNAFGEDSGNPLQYSCLENTMDRGAW